MRWLVHKDLTAEKERIEVKNVKNRGCDMAKVQTDDPQERLVVMDSEHLHIIGRYLQAMILNFLKEPEKVRAIEKLNLMVAIEPTGSADNSVTLTFESGRLTLECGTRPNPDIKIKCETAVLMKLSRMPAGPAAIKFLMTYEGRDLIARVRSGELKINGILRHPFGMMKFSKFLAPNIN
jgi:hypothetical protein